MEKADFFFGMYFIFAKFLMSSTGMSNSHEREKKGHALAF